VEYGFANCAIYSVREFQEKANSGISTSSRGCPYDTIVNKPRPVTEDDVEREFWRLVESVQEPVKVKYGADIHYGSWSSTIGRHPCNPYSPIPGI
jgi:histone demethylase JARID1